MKTKSIIQRGIPYVLCLCLMLSLLIQIPSVYAQENDLQKLIDDAAEGTTVTLSANTTYTGDVTIDKALTIEGSDTTSIIDGTVSYNKATVLNKLTIRGGIHGQGKFTLTNSTVFGGIQIEDSNEVVLIQTNVLHYDNSTPALKITGTPTSTNYGIGRDTSLSSDNAAKANTFINDGSSSAIAISWPVSNAAADNRLDVHVAYWKKGSVDASFYDVAVDGNVKYANEMALYLKSSFDSMAKPLSPEGFPYRKKAGNTNMDYIEFQDITMLLFGRSFETNGTPTPLFYDYAFNIIFDNKFKMVTLPKTYQVKMEFASIYKDNNFGTSFENPEKVTLGNGSNIYTGSSNPMMPVDITPKSMVSYAGTSDTLSADFPTVLYDYQAQNIYYDPATSSKEEEYINFKNITQQIENGGTTVDVNYLSAYMQKEKKYYMPWMKGGTQESNYITDPALDPDGDLFPFLSGISTEDDKEVASNGKGGIYQISVTNADDVSRLEYNRFMDQQNQWPEFSLGVSNRWNVNELYTVYHTADLTIRPTSGDLTVEGVADTLPNTHTNPVAAIEDAAAYKDSTGQNIQKASVSLLNDNQEPDSNAYAVMLETAQKNDATKGKKVDYHFLSLLNTNDGNNVITTPSEKTVFIPYPADYKEGSALNMLYFDGYQRMPSDNIEDANVVLIPDKDITKLDDGFTFTTTSDMGAYLLAYETNAVIPPESNDSSNTDSSNTDSSSVSSDSSSDTSSSVSSDSSGSTSSSASSNVSEGTSSLTSSNSSNGDSSMTSDAANSSNSNTSADVTLSVTTNTSTASGSNSPKTGDSGAFFAMMLLLSTGMLTVLAVVCRRKANK